MNNKTKAILIVIAIAIAALGYCFVNTTAQMQATFAKVGAFVIAAFIIIVAIVLIVLIKKAKTKKAKKDNKTE